jgi:hypothetical protein
MYASPSRLPQPGALLNSYGLVICVISGIKLDNYQMKSNAGTLIPGVRFTDSFAVDIYLGALTEPS